MQPNVFLHLTVLLSAGQFKREIIPHVSSGKYRTISVSYSSTARLNAERLDLLVLQQRQRSKVKGEDDGICWRRNSAARVDTRHYAERSSSSGNRSRRQTRRCSKEFLCSLEASRPGRIPCRRPQTWSSIRIHRQTTFTLRRKCLFENSVRSFDVPSAWQVVPFVISLRNRRGEAAGNVITYADNCSRRLRGIPVCPECWGGVRVCILKHCTSGQYVVMGLNLRNCQVSVR